MIRDENSQFHCGRCEEPATVFSEVPGFLAVCDGCATEVAADLLLMSRSPMDSRVVVARALVEAVYRLGDGGVGRNLHAQLDDLNLADEHLVNPFAHAIYPIDPVEVRCVDALLALPLVLRYVAVVGSDV